MSDQFAGLVAIVQYRRKHQTEFFDPWHNMAAFDSRSMADKYFEKQGNETWEYRVIDAMEDA